MKCEKIQELVLTDYLDEQLGAEQTKVLEAHLAECPACRQFAAHARRTVAAPFLQAESLNPPENLWPKIKESLAADQAHAQKNLCEKFRESLRAMAPVPRMAFALTFVFVLSMSIGVVTKFVSNKKTAEQMEYLAYLARPSTGSVAGEEQGLGTFIEQYFL